jgi:hypothetical protein
MKINITIPVNSIYTEVQKENIQVFLHKKSLQVKPKIGTGA